MGNCKLNMQASTTTLQLLETQIDAKRKQLEKFKELYSTMKFPRAEIEESKRISDKSCDEESSFKLLDGLADKCVNWKSDEEKLKLEVAQLDAQIQTKMGKFGEIEEGKRIPDNLCDEESSFKLLDELADKCDNWKSDEEKLNWK